MDTSNLFKQRAVMQAHFGDYMPDTASDKDRNIARLKNSFLREVTKYDDAIDLAHPNYIIQDILAVIEENLNAQDPASVHDLEDICLNIIQAHYDDLDRLAVLFHEFNNWDYGLYLDDWNEVLKGRQKTFYDRGEWFEISDIEVHDMKDEISGAFKQYQEWQRQTKDHYELLEVQISRLEDWWRSPNKKIIFEAYKFLSQLREPNDKAFRWGALNHG